MQNEVIRIPHHISQTFIRKHLDWVFLYGMDYYRTGMMGQMWVAHGEPNCVGIITCEKLCPSNKRYLNDYSDVHRGWLHHSLEMIPSGKIVIPIRKIGEGASRMKELAPRSFKFMTDYIGALKYPNIEIISDTQ